MALDLSRYDLPATPSAGTGLYDLPVHQQVTIMEYLTDLSRAKTAGVAGRAIGAAQPFIDGVASARVKAAQSGHDVWTAECDKMVAERKEWRIRIADRGIRAIAPGRAIPDPGRSKAVMAIVRRTAGLEADVLAALERAFDHAAREDRRLAAQALPNVPEPSLGTLLSRAMRAFEADAHADRVRTAIQQVPDGAWHAAVGAYLGDGIEPPFRAILAGAWEAVVLGDPELLTHAWSAEADELRSDFLGLPAEAYLDPDRF